MGGCAGITCPPQHNAHAIVWPGVGRINGLLIPSLQSFTIPVPARLDPQSSGEVFEVGLTQHHLYLIGGTSRVFSAPAPTALRKPAPPRYLKWPAEFSGQERRRIWLGREPT